MTKHMAKRSRLRPALERLEDRLAPAVFNVNSLADILSPPAGVVTLRSAIEAANATPGNNTIDLTLAGTYKITIPGAGEDLNATGDFDILPTSTASSSGSLTIVNTSGGHAFVDGNHLDRVFDINPTDGNPPMPFAVTMKGFTVQNGSAAPGDGPGGSGGGIRDQGPVSLTLTNMVITGNTASADGGGVSMENVASTKWTLTINNSDITNNKAGDAGGGVETDGSLGKVVINAGTVISGNTSVNRGATASGSTRSQVGTVFQEGGADADGHARQQQPGPRRGQLRRRHRQRRQQRRHHHRQHRREQLLRRRRRRLCRPE